MYENKGRYTWGRHWCIRANDIKDGCHIPVFPGVEALVIFVRLSMGSPSSEASEVMVSFCGVPYDVCFRFVGRDD